MGRGNRDGAQLFREWYAGLSAAAADDRRGAYVFVMGSLAELLRVFDFPIVFPEINSLQTAVRHAAHEYLNEAEDYGYSPDICGYVKADVATQLRMGKLPMATHSEAGHRGLHECLQHLHQVGGDLGADVPHPDRHDRRPRLARRRASSAGRATATSTTTAATSRRSSRS